MATMRQIIGEKNTYDDTWCFEKKQQRKDLFVGGKFNADIVDKYGNRINEIYVQLDTLESAQKSYDFLRILAYGLKQIYPQIEDRYIY